MLIIHHQLPDDFYLLPLQGCNVVNSPIWVARRTRVRSHLRHHAVFLQLAVQRVTRLGMIRKRLVGKRRIETDANVIVEGIGSLQLAIAGLNIRRPPRGRIARILREIKVSNHRIEIALP